MGAIKRGGEGGGGADGAFASPARPNQVRMRLSPDVGQEAGQLDILRCQFLQRKGPGHAGAMLQPKPLRRRVAANGSVALLLVTGVTPESVQTARGPSRGWGKCNIFCSEQ
jgi:hypothetical protein